MAADGRHALGKAGSFDRAGAAHTSLLEVLIGLVGARFLYPPAVGGKLTSRRALIWRPVHTHADRSGIVNVAGA